MADLKLIKSAEEQLRKFNIEELKEAGLLNCNDEFLPSVHYPSITMYPPADEDSLFRGYKNPPDNLFSVYAHIPFCIRHCVFCHYPVKTDGIAQEKDRYLNTIEKEIGVYMSKLGLEKIRAKSILVGGGTPTHLSAGQLKRFLAFFTDRIDLTRCTQFSYDVDPATLITKEGRERLDILRSYGVDRLTIGIQSLDDKILKNMQRPHTAENAVKSVELAKKCGFKINIEFIFGYPGQTLDIWAETIKKAVSLDVEEIQLYRLKVIPYGDCRGLITKAFKEMPDNFIDLEETLLMKALAQIILSKNGYHENLTRVFSKTAGDFSHYAADQCCNLIDQIGFGLTAFSSLRDRFVLNTQSFKEYYSLINQGRLAANRGLVRNKDDQTRWAIILPLKNRKVYKSHYRKITGVPLGEVFRKKIESLKSFDLLYEDDKTLALTDRGRFLADEVCQQFHHPRYMPFGRNEYAEGKLNPYN